MSHPQINQFYDDVEAKKKGGKRKRAKKSKGDISLKNAVHIHIGDKQAKHKKKSLSQRITHVSRLMSTPSIFANPPAVQQPSHFAVGAGVGQWTTHEHPQGTAPPASRVAEQQMVPRQTNPAGIVTGVIPSKYRVSLTRNMKQSGGVMTSNPALVGREPVPLPKEAYEKQSTKDMSYDGIQPHVSQNYFAPTGAPGNHLAPHAAQHAAPKSGFEPLEAQRAPSRESLLERMKSGYAKRNEEHVAAVASWRDLPHGAAHISQTGRPLMVEERAGEKRLHPVIHGHPAHTAALRAAASAFDTSTLPAEARERVEKYRQSKHGGRYHALSVF